MMDTDRLYYIKTETLHGYTEQRVCALASELPCMEEARPLRIARTEQGKPYFTDAPYPLYFSVSHSGNLWTCLFSARPVGLDIQQVPENKDLPRIARRFFHPDEVRFLTEFGWDKFSVVWCAKESYVKYTGKGIAGELSRFSVVENDQIKKEIEGIPLRRIEGFPRYACYVCGGSDGLIQRISREDPAG